MTKDDSASFNFISFETALITKTEANLVCKIWLIKMYENKMPASVNSFERDFENLKNYLDTELHMVGISTNENKANGGYIEGFKWVTDELTYRLRRGMNKLSNTLSVEIY